MATYLETYKKVKSKLEETFTPKLAQIAYDCLKCAQEMGEDGWTQEAPWLRDTVRHNANLTGMYDLLGQCYKLLAKVSFDDYLIYLEWRRPPEKKFYLPRRHVLKVVVDDLQDLFDDKIDFLGVSMPARTGKLVADDVPVLTSEGWKKHGELKVGDKVVSPNGKYVKVIHVFPKDYANIRVHFADKTYVDVHENHEWLVYNRRSHREMVLETNQMIDDYDKPSGRCNYFLPGIEPMRGEHKDLPVAPYTFGAWLGDGRNTNPDICGPESDYAIVEHIVRDGYEISWHTTHKTTGVKYYGFKSLRVGLQKIGLCHSRRRVPKYIPDIYLTASLEQRLELLAGLLDTDGTLTSIENRYHFSTTEPELRDGFVQLISTFGWRASVSADLPKVSSSGVIGRKTVYQIGFNPTFYIPCVLPRKQLHVFSKQRRLGITGFEYIEPKQGNCITVEGGMYCVGERMHPTHNSTLCIMFMTWLMGNRPDVASVMSGHSDKLTDGFYREILSIITDDATYNWSEIFSPLKIVDKSAKNETIDLGKPKRFPTMTCRSVGGTLTGAVEVGTGGILYCDDLVEDLEESLNPNRLQAKYDAYLNQLKDRKKQGAKELMVATRWNVFDPLGRIAAQYEGNPRYRFRVLPAVDDEGHSNFVYKYGLGFDDAYYHDIKESIDDATWWAKYMGKPYIREGLLFPANDLNYYNGVLPDGEPDEIIAVCDTAWGGGDSLSMPFAYCYGNDIYIHDVIFNRGDKTVTRPIVIAKMKTHRPHKTRFEQNNGGDEYADIVDSELRKDGVRLNITSKRSPSNQSKLSRIIMFAPEIKRMFFIDEKHRSKEYNQFMNELTMFVQTGKNLHDDAPDSLGMLADFKFNGIATMTAMKRPF